MELYRIQAVSISHLLDYQKTFCKHSHFSATQFQLFLSYIELYRNFSYTLTHVDDCAITRHTVADLGIGDYLDKVNFSTVQFLPDTVCCVCYADVCVVILSYGNGSVNICAITTSPADSSNVILTLCIGLNVVRHTWGYRKKAMIDTQPNITTQIWYKCQKIFFCKFSHL